MNLYRFDPPGHGQYSFFVVADNVVDAHELVSKFIRENKQLYPYDYAGFFEAKYEINEIPAGVVTCHEND